jgi:predicted nucleotidyltransferase
MQKVNEEMLKQDPALAEIVRRLVQVFQPESIYLFGSKARRDARSDSDYDIMVIVSQSSLPGYRRDQVAYRSLLGVGVAKDVIVWTREEFESRVHLPASFAATIVREGQLLYAA